VGPLAAAGPAAVWCSQVYAAGGCTGVTRTNGGWC